MTYLLDTSAMIRADAAVAAWLASVGRDDQVVTCAIARGEILFGIERLAAGRRRTELVARAASVFAALPCEPVPAAVGDVYATVRSGQQRRGLSLDENDLWIAATALALKATPVSATLASNDSDFQPIELPCPPRPLNRFPH